MSFENRRSTMEGGATAGSTGTNIQSQTSVTHCKNGCGFYANSAFEGMCSKCFRDELLRRQEMEKLSPEAITSGDSAPGSPMSSSSQTDTTLTCSATSDSATTADDASDSPIATTAEKSLDATMSQSLETGSPTVITMRSSDKEKTSVNSATDVAAEDEKSVKEKPKRNRCLTCRKKVGLTGFGCRCGGLFCSVHRYSDKHDCSFDYKELGQEQIRKNNPVVLAEKIKKL